MLLLIETETDCLKVDIKAVPVCLYFAKVRSVKELVTVPPPTARDQIDWTHPKMMTLQLNMSPECQSFGAFKQASMGTAGEAVFKGSQDICVKQFITIKAKNFLNTAGKHVCIEQPVVIDRQSQLKNALGEINCLVWGHALLEMTYQWIERETLLQGLDKPPIPIPKLQFVQAALAYEQGDQNRVFMVEELIDKDKEGPFRKYIHNASALPIFWGSAGDNEDRAAFLAFSQHFQYWKLSKQIFVTDYQGESNSAVSTVSSLLTFTTGGDRLLTDPQIVTNE
jgi:Alpha-kinase family